MTWMIDNCVPIYGPKFDVLIPFRSSGVQDYCTTFNATTTSVDVLRILFFISAIHC